MRDKVTDSDRAFAAAVEASEPAIPAPDYMEMMLKTRALAEGQSKRKKSARPRRIPRTLRRALLVAGVMVVIFAVSAILSVTMPPPSASADSWFSRTVMVLRNAFQVGTSPGEIRDLDEAEERVYTSIEEARADGYNGYAPTYLPQGFSVEQIFISELGEAISTIFTLSNGDVQVMLKYDKGQNTQVQAIQDEATAYMPFQWNGFYGVTVEHDGGILFLSCINEEDDEGILISGNIKKDDAVAIIYSMEK